MSEIFSPGNHRAASHNNTGNDFENADSNTGFPTRRMRRVSQDPISFAGQGGALTAQPQQQLTRRARREPDDRKDYEERLVRDYFSAEQGAERQPQDAQQPTRGEQRAMIANDGKNFPLQAAPGETAAYSGLQRPMPPRTASREEERFEEFLRSRQSRHNDRQAFERQNAFEQTRPPNSAATNRDYPAIQDRWSLPRRDFHDHQDDDLTGYLPGKQKVFVDPTASDNLAMVQPAGYGQPGQAGGSAMKPPTTSHIPVITASQSIVRDQASDSAVYPPRSGQSFHGLSSRSSLLARAEQIAAGGREFAGSTGGKVDIGAVNARLLQEQQMMAGREQARYAQNYQGYTPTGQMNALNTGAYQAVDGAYLADPASGYGLPYQYPNGGEHNPPLASGDARGLQPINTRIAGTKSRVEKIATIAVTAGICLVFSAVVFSIFFVK